MKFELMLLTKARWCTHDIYRIRALKSFGDVKGGDFGGCVETEDNLSQEGDCWLYEEAYSVGKARVFGNAKLYNRVRAYDRAQIFGNAEVRGLAEIYGDAHIFGNARIDNGYALICGQTKINIDMVDGIKENITGQTLFDRDFLVPGSFDRPKVVSAIR